ncbi:phosphoenolpyruvate synthase [Desmospora profundinema]|uniref:Pyruvate,water dikinase n=1 Tax=Desmospora profundinema TaxID=1571184 RepID=A0ABU1IK69_9BACL|nr:phosphoenolpyruvate synthase [Desmospora profundinema]MDR6224384.1 pyruvate,water dikinase [Desmospora profundinema]
MCSYVLGFDKIDHTKRGSTGGKGANLGECWRIKGVRVPEGFCVTTEAYKRMIGQNQVYHALLDQLSSLQMDDKERVSQISGKIRKVIKGVAISPDIAGEIAQSLSQLGKEHAYAVRSSATAEDLPTASFAGQQDTYLNIIGKEEILKHISKCWASLFTDRAVIYRMQNGLDHRQVYLSVIIQRMVFPQASGVLFTADPVTSNRKVLTIDAGFGLGEALVSGLVSADHYNVRMGKIVDKTISTKKWAVYASKDGGTEERKIEPHRQNRQILTDEQILELAVIGRKIEAHFSCPQDIEWCLVDDQFYIVQSRPITTLYPIPDGDEGQSRVYLSMGHQQMMTDPIKPLGMSFFQVLSEDYPLRKAGGRLFVDLTHDLASPIGRKIVLSTMGKNDRLTKSAIVRLVQRKDFMKSLPRGKRVLSMKREGLSWRLPVHMVKTYLSHDTGIVQDLIFNNEESVRSLQQRITAISGDELFAFILEDFKELKEILYNPRSLGAILVGVHAASWINRNMEKWLGEKNAADTLSQSVSNNVTSEMGLALLDVADVVRPYPAVIQYFHHASDETFFEDLAKLEGGRAVRNSIQAYLKKYGMRCPGEIDITNPRWSEQPTALIPMILRNIKNFEPHARRVKFERGRLEAEQKEQQLLSRLKELPGGKRKVKKTKKMIHLLRHFIGYREYPKYAFIQRYFIYKQALLKEAANLVQKGVIPEKEDVYYLSFEELREVVRTNRLDNAIITERKEEYAVYEKLKPPRILTSEGECITGELNNKHVPRGALTGIPVSSGIIEGRARVVSKMEEANIDEGDILVTTSTDPSWTPLFVSIKGFVTEVGGVMTHGSVIAREYGLPAVVGVENATKQVQDGQRIRVNGTEGYVEIL